MTADKRIILIAASGENAGWLTVALSGIPGHHVSVLHTDVFSDSIPDADAYILDASIGQDVARDVLAGILNEKPASAVLVGIDAADLGSWDTLIRLGAQDTLFRDRDEPADMARRIANAIDRARILDATQEAEIRLRTIIENIQDGVLIVDKAGVVMFANPAAEFLLDRDLDELYGMAVPTDIPLSGEDFVRIEPANSLGRTLHVRAHDVRWEGREAHLVTFRDVTNEQEIREQLRLARKAAEEASAMKSTFLANMSHELRMPLASIIGFAQLIEEGTDHDDYREFAQTIQESGNRLLTTIIAVLEATRLEKHHLEPIMQPVRLDVLIEEVVSTLQPLLQNEKVTLSCVGRTGDSSNRGAGSENRGSATDAAIAGATNAPLVIADEDFLIRILNNLIGNAAKFTSEGSILVSWEMLDDVVRIDVKDTGKGMAKEFLPHIFDEFSQESTGAGRSHEGTGLGLTIVKGLVDLMDGRIEVTSEPGQGSCFSVYLPTPTISPDSSD